MELCGKRIAARLATHIQECLEIGERLIRAVFPHLRDTEYAGRG